MPADTPQQLIRTGANLWEFVRADRAAFSEGGPTRFRQYSWPPLRFVLYLRLSEYATNCWQSRGGKAIAAVVRRWVQTRGLRLGYTIPENVFGPGLSIAHWGTIVVNRHAKVGARCRLHAGVNIGINKGGYPIVGDDAYIGPGAKLFGSIVLGDRCRVGANSVVTKSFPADSVIVGVPGRLSISTEA